MEQAAHSRQPVHAGNQDGLGSIYDAAGILLGRPGESLIEVAAGWDMEVWSPWRRLLPKALFVGFHGKVASKLYVTSERIVLIREIDPWRETSEEMSPLGIPNALSKQADLRKLRRAGVKEFCEVYPPTLHLVSSRRYVKRGSVVDMRMIGNNGRQYAISFWKTDGKDERLLAVLEAQFHK